MLVPIMAAFLGVAGIIGLFLSAVVGGTSLADWVLDASQAFLVLGAIIFEGYIIIGIIMDVAHGN